MDLSKINIGDEIIIKVDEELRNDIEYYTRKNKNTIPYVGEFIKGTVTDKHYTYAIVDLNDFDSFSKNFKYHVHVSYIIPNSKLTEALYL